MENQDDPTCRFDMLRDPPSLRLRSGRPARQPIRYNRVSYQPLSRNPRPDK
jgi:hypothetical protein